jgi:hypothetical protein
MKKFAYIGLFTFTCLSQLAYGALPPFYETRNEFKALIDSAELESLLGSGEGIWEIKRNEENFLITSTKYTLAVKVIYEHTGLMGPAKFHFEFGKPVPRTVASS